MRYFRVIFENEKTLETMDLVFNVLENSTAQKWFYQMNHDLRTLGHDEGRFEYFGEENKQDTIDTLNKIIGYLNDKNYSDLPRISEKTLDKKMCNFLHDHFVKNRNSKNYGNRSQEYKAINEEFNKMIHIYEHLLGKGPRPKITCSFHGREILPLDDSDYENFTYDAQRGDVFITYCVTGKPYYRVFKDNDDVCDEDDIQPQRVYSSNFVIRLSDKPLIKITDDFVEWLSNRNLDINDKRLALGKIKVAEPTLPIDEDTIKKLANYKRIKQIKVY